MVLCDEDVHNMLCLAKSFGLDHIGVLIQTRSETSDMRRFCRLGGHLVLYMLVNLFGAAHMNFGQRFASMPLNVGFNLNT
ncbi:hypothetical protein ACSBR1_029570 [Camellia fascicularis]